LHDDHAAEIPHGGGNPNGIKQRALDITREATPHAYVVVVLGQVGVKAHAFAAGTRGVTIPRSLSSHKVRYTVSSETVGILAWTERKTISASG